MTAADLAGKVVVITGAAGNLGRAVTAACARAGAALALLDRDEAGLAAAARLAATAPRALAVPADALDPAAMEGAAERVARELGRVDALCHLIGGFRMGDPVHATPPEVWRLMLDLNAGSLLNAVRAFVPRILAGGRGGKVVSVAAAAAARGAARMGAYSAAKAAAVRLTESLSAELRGAGVNVNCVLPTTMDTPQNRAAMPEADPRDWVAPEAVADVILFLCTDAARAVHGAAIPVSARA
ncbi:SDR family oxidoreductase [Caldovatus aquaticus]|uniref:SDR family oxidoreductase n=1 Tax=Caldovatus aquaticus TaxID=2865671 RepID=A0ABS7EXK8_9PROT|nr:SDR family oxidoreductase [Caldovatus aquaticus]MBW8268100.1 SDR family oxidoreductase [Caldovatus aquaticus]